MYTGYFGLKEIPFSIAPNPHFLFMSDRHREALAHLTYGLGETGGFVLLTGEVGTGKTTISRCLLEQLPENSQAAFILNPTLSSHELLATICDELKIRYRKTGATLKTLTDKIQAKLLKNHAEDIHTILIIDEAQHLQAEVLEQLRLLTNLETHTKKLLQVILIGQPELQQLLQRNDLRQLAQRITARYHLMPLNKQEVAQYIQHRLQVAECHQPLFSQSAIATIHKLSKGIPRLINLLCDRALLGAYGAGKPIVDKKLVIGASKEALGIEFQPKKWWQNSMIKGVLVSILLMTTISVGYLLAQFPQILDTNSHQTKSSSPLKAQTNWSDIIAQSRSLPLSVNALFSAWRIVLDEQITEPCLLANEYALSCHWFKGNLPSLLKLGYPAVFQFTDEKGNAFYGLLKAVNGAKLQFQFNQSIEDVSATWLNKYWQGGALIFWQPPVDNQGDFVQVIDENSGIEQLQWLESRLSELQKRPKRQVQAFDAVLVNQLNQYQVNQGVAKAALVDERVLMMLANTVAEGLPIFSNNRVSE